ncbi:restriction endonuclease subunit S [Bacteroides fragilis]|uniref:restriction endonuclease subunit S n=1 Tax=Bacteroides fragilis TaxID=817 RepID=UPI003704C265
MCFLFSLHTPHYQNVPFVVPNNWVWCRLDDLAFYKKGPFGSSLTKAMFVQKGDDTYKVYEQKNAIQKDHELGSYYISKEKYCSLSSFAVHPYDIIVSCAGTIGETYVLPQNIQEGIINQALMLIRLYNREIERFYLLYFDFILKQEAYKESKGTAIKNIPPFDVLKNFLIPIPPKEEQNRILSEVDKWMSFVNAIETNSNDLQTIIKQTKNKILDLAIHGKLVPQDPNDEPAIKLLKRINPDFTPCDNGHYTQLPQGWTVCKIKQITNITNGKSQKNVETPNGIYPIYGSGGVIGRANQYLCIAGSTIIGRKGTINNPIFVEEHFWNVDTAFGLKADSALLDKYLYYFCLSFDFSKLDKSTAMPSLTKTSIGDVLIPVPPYQEQKRIVSKIDTVLDTINVIMESL